MIRPVVIAALLGTISTAATARVGPEIAYSIGNQIFLIDPTGSGNVQIHRASGNAFIESLALKKGGGTIAFIEKWVLKFMDYDSAGRRVGTIRSLPGCYRQYDVQFAPDGNSVIYGELCGDVRSIRQVAVPTSANPNPVPQTLLENAELVDVGSFDGSGQSFVYTTSVENGWELRRHFLDGNDVLVTPVGLGSQLRAPSLSHDGAKVLVSDWNGSLTGPGIGYIDEYDAATGASIRANFQAAIIGDYEPLGGRILYTEKQGKTAYLRYLDASGLPHQLAKSGAFMAFNDIDWGE